MAGNREVALRNLAKSHAVKGGGRPKETPERKMQKLAIKEHFLKYLESGEASKDFEKMRKKHVDKALKLAYESHYGTPKQSIEHTGEVEIKEIVVRFKNCDSNDNNES